MEDKRKLVTVITSAVSAYLQTEQPVYSTAAAAEATAPPIKPGPGPKINQWKIMGRWKLTTVDRKIGVRI